MLKLARTKAKNPAQEALRERKAKWNAKVSAFIDDLIQFKKWMNGHENKFYSQRNKITEPLPNDPFSIVSILMSDFQKLGAEGRNIIDHQKSYSSSLLNNKAASTSLSNLEKTASNRLTRFLSNFKGPMFFGTKKEKLTNKFRLDILKSLAGMKEQIRDIQTDILFKPLKEFPNIGSAAEQLALKAKEFNTVQKAYKDLVVDTPVSSDSNYKIIADLKSIQSELKSISALPFFAAKKVNTLTRKLQMLLKKIDTDTSITTNMNDAKIERNIITNEFIEIRRQTIDTWQSVFPNTKINSIANIHEIIESSGLAYEDLVDRAKNNSADNPNVIEKQRRQIVVDIQNQLVLATELPVYYNRQTVSLSKKSEIILQKIDSGRNTKNSIDVEINSLTREYKTLLNQTLTLWGKILLRKTSELTSFKDLLSMYKESGISEEDAIKAAGAYPVNRSNDDITSQFFNIMGRKHMVNGVARDFGDAFYMQKVCDDFLSDDQYGNLWSQFPKNSYTKLVTLYDALLDRDQRAIAEMKMVIEEYNVILLYVNTTLIDAGLITKPFYTFFELFNFLKENAFDSSKISTANAITYHIAKRIGELKNKIPFGNKAAALRLRLSDIYSFYVKIINDYMNILEDRMLLPEEFEDINKKLENMFHESKDPLKAFEQAYVLTIYDNTDTETSSGYEKNLKNVLRRQDKSNIRKVLT